MNENDRIPVEELTEHPFIAEDLKPFIDLVDQYSNVLYVTQLLIRFTIHIDPFRSYLKSSVTCKDFNEYIWYLIV